MNHPPDPRRFSIVPPAKNEAVGLSKLLPAWKRQYPRRRDYLARQQRELADDNGFMIYNTAFRKGTVLDCTAPYTVTGTIYFSLPQQGLGSDTLHQLGAVTLGLAVLHVLERVEIIGDDDASIRKLIFVA